MIRFELLSPGRRLPGDYWTPTVAESARVEIEIGPGDGRFLIESARRDPATVWVGFEVRIGLVRKVAGRADLPPNVRIHHVDAGWVVQHLIADESIDAFHVYFPDPWWKKRHQKRKLFTPAFAGSVARCLRRQGSVYLVTDVEPLFVEAAELLQAAGLSVSTWTRDPSSPAQSSYERKYRRQGRRLFETRFVKP